MSYYREEHPADIGDLRPLIPWKHSKDVWTTKDGRSIPFSELETLHLVNIMKMIGRSIGVKTKATNEDKVRTLEIVKKELKRRKKWTP